MSTDHITVYQKEAVELLQVQAENWYIDATLGAGGHTAEILSKNARVLAIDWDKEVIEAQSLRFKSEIEAGRLKIVHDSFGNLAKVAQEHLNNTKIAGVLFDFGTSTDQLTSSERGFSVHGDGPLDMRMDTRLGVTAADILAVVPESQLAQAFKELGGEEESKSIARTIKRNLPITTSGQLAKLINIAKKRRIGHLHPATKVFQALRIIVNQELEAIESALPQVIKLIQAQGTIVTIAFHEGEDRLVKHQFIAWQNQGLGTILTKKPLQPSPEEVENNVRSRSAKIRAFRST